MLERLDALQAASSRSGCVLLRPLLKAGAMERHWAAALEQQKDVDRRLVEKMKLDIAESDEVQRLLAQQPPTPRSPLKASVVRRSAAGNHTENELVRAYSEPAARASMGLLAAKMGTTEAQVTPVHSNRSCMQKCSLLKLQN
eukprot:COSAG03_NODE_916_length_5340_cov_5.358138_6_plen_142_part_00